MKYHIFSDPHCGHRKFFTDEQSHELVKKIQKTVGEDDILICLGDVAFTQSVFWNQLITSCCKCRKWLVKGNHDKKSDKWFLDRGWDFVAEEFVIRRMGLEVSFTHVPKSAMVWDRDFKPVNIHGHLHSEEESHRDIECDYISPERHFLVESHKMYEVDNILKNYF